MVNSKQENIPSPRTVGNDENFISKFEASGYGCRLPKKNVVGNAQIWNGITGTGDGLIPVACPAYETRTNDRGSAH